MHSNGIKRNRSYGSKTNATSYEMSAVGLPSTHNSTEHSTNISSSITIAIGSFTSGSNTLAYSAMMRKYYYLYPFFNTSMDAQRQ